MSAEISPSRPRPRRTPADQAASMLDNRSRLETRETRHRSRRDFYKREMCEAEFRRGRSRMERRSRLVVGERERAKEKVARDRIDPRPRATRHVRKQFHHGARCFAPTREISRAAAPCRGIRAMMAAKNKSRG